VSTVRSELAEFDRSGNANGDRLTAATVGSIYLPDTIISDLIGVYSSDKELFFRHCVTKAHEGSAEAAALVALIYYNGVVEHGQKRLEKARKWAEVATWAKSPFGEYVLGLIRLELQQHSEALSVLESAADRGFAPALWLVGRMYEDGIGTDRNPKLAGKYYLESHKAGYLLGGTSYAKVARGGFVGRLSAILAWVSIPWNWIIFQVRNRFSSRVWVTHLVPLPMVEMLRKYRSDSGN
jgi:TPR repeat protein